MNKISNRNRYKSDWFLSKQKIFCFEKKICCWKIHVDERKNFPEGPRREALLLRVDTAHNIRPTAKHDHVLNIFSNILLWQLLLLKY